MIAFRRNRLQKSLFLLLATCYLPLLVLLAGLSKRSYCQDRDLVYIIPIKGIIDLGLSGFLKRIAQEAEQTQAKLVILEIDTYGGRVDAAGEIVKTLEGLKPIKTVAFVIGEAWSAGALISLASQEIYMAPGASIGSAEPRIMGAAQETEDEKMLSALRAKFKATAQLNGHSVKLAEAMVDKDIELKKVSIKNKVMILTPEEIEEKKKTFPDKDIKIIKTITEKDKLLNLTAQEAKELNLAKDIIQDRKTLLKLFNLEEIDIVETKPTWSENLVRFLTHPVVSSLLLTLGFLGIIFELKIPGWGIAGTLGVISLALFFWGHYLVGLANWTEVLLFILSLILIGLEIFIIPGFGIAGILGAIFLVSSIFLALVKHPLQAPKTELMQALGVVVFSFFATIALGLATIYLFPKTGTWKKIILPQAEKKEEGFATVDLTEENLMGKIGKALTSLRPAGKMEFEDKILDVVTEGDYIDKGKSVRIERIEGNKIIVKSV